MMIHVIPTVFAHTKEEFQKRFSSLIKFAPAIQIDFMDEEFVPAKSVPLSIVPDLKKFKVKFEAHLMVAHPEEWIEEVAKKGFSKIIVHIETIKNTERGLDLFHRIRTRGAQPMLAINAETSMERLEPYLTCIQDLLVMGIHPGREHQGLVPNTARRVSMLKKRGFFVQVDGGVNDRTIGKLVSAGVDVVNVGSYIADAKDHKKAYQMIVQAFKK